jgi:hypothetical protein
MTRVWASVSRPSALPISTGCVGPSPSRPWRRMPSPRRGGIRRRRRWPSLAPTRPRQAPRPGSGHNQDGRAARKQVLRSFGGSGEGGLPLRMPHCDGKTRDSVDGRQAITDRLARGRTGITGSVAESKADCQRPLGRCLDQQGGWSRWSRIPVPAARREKPGGNSHGPCPGGWSPLVDAVRTRPDGGAGAASPGRGVWRGACSCVTMSAIALP